MNGGPYRFQLGKFECLVVLDGIHTYSNPAKSWFTNVPKGVLSEALGQYNIDPENWDYASPYPSLVINTGDNVVLVDTGAGSLLPSTGKLIRNLESATISSEDIDTVILTHGHPDHIGGAVDSDGDLAFPNARYVMSKDELAFWTSEDVEEKVPKRHRWFVPSVRHYLDQIRGRLDLIGDKTEIVPGIHAVAVPGHTPGHMAVSVASEGELLLHISDAAVHPVHIEHPDWRMDEIDPVRAVISRRLLIERAAAEKALVHIFHFPFPGLGHVIEIENAWQWKPIDM